MCCTATAAAQQRPLECQPRVGIHLHTPIFHIIGRMEPTKDGQHWPRGATDGNAVFGHAGVFHVMHQTPNRTSHTPTQPTDGYWAAWGHVLSYDLAHFHRLDNALDPSFNSTYDWHDGDCDGTVSFVPEDAVDGGVLATFGPDCARPVGPKPPPRSQSSSVGAELGDAPRVGLARLADPTDQKLLSRWRKDTGNPILFGTESPPCAFSGRIWRPENGRNWSMICAVNSLSNAWGRYTTVDKNLHGPWHLVDPSFATYNGGTNDKPWPCAQAIDTPPCPVGSISAPSFLPLPPYKGKQTYTHMINAGGGRAYILGKYDEATQKLSASGPVQTVESMGSGSNWYVAGVSQADRRVLHVGFFEPRDGALMYDWDYSLQQRSFTVLSLIRSLSWAPQHHKLLSNPVAELAMLRNRSLFHLNASQVKPTQWLELISSADQQTGASTSMDVELSVALPQSTQHEKVRFSLRVLGAVSPEGNATEIVVEVETAGKDGLRHGTLSIFVPRMTVDCGDKKNCPGMGVGWGWVPWGNLTAPFTLLPTEGCLELRVLVDRSCVEAFAAGGRAVVSVRDFPREEEAAARLRNDAVADLLLKSARGWSMDCGWI